MRALLTHITRSTSQGVSWLAPTWLFQFLHSVFKDSYFCMCTVLVFQHPHSGCKVAHSHGNHIMPYLYPYKRKKTIHLLLFQKLRNLSPNNIDRLTSTVHCSELGHIVGKRNVVTMKTSQDLTSDLGFLEVNMV
jgi:hypothetical protein